jgi:hypothetical protein
MFCRTAKPSGAWHIVQGCYKIEEFQWPDDAHITEALKEPIAAIMTAHGVQQMQAVAVLL